LLRTKKRIELGESLIAAFEYFYGKLGWLYSSDSILDGPVGKAKIDYENWIL